jgi:hypothetical protein
LFANSEACSTSFVKQSVCFIVKLQPEDERLSSQENDVTVSITPNDHSNALHNDGLVEEHGGTPRGQPNQGKSTLLERSWAWSSGDGLTFLMLGLPCTHILCIRY